MRAHCYNHLKVRFYLYFVMFHFVKVHPLQIKFHIWWHYNGWLGKN